jgi:3-hydroxyacyl-CoA dehydrogenase
LQVHVGTWHRLHRRADSGDGGTTSSVAWHDVVLVVECIPENLLMKQQLFAEFDMPLLCPF